MPTDNNTTDSISTPRQQECFPAQIAIRTGAEAFQELRRIVEDVSPQYDARTSSPEIVPPLQGAQVPVDGGQIPPANEASSATFPESLVWVSFALLADDPGAIPVQLSGARVPGLLNAVGIASVRAGLRDVQFYLQRRVSKASSGLIEIWGVIADIDRPAIDPLEEAQRARIPLPNLHFPTVNGFKLAQLFSRPATIPEAEQRAKELTLSFDGGDPRSWWMSQAQRLPTCLKTVEGGAVAELNYRAILANSHPFDPSLGSGVFPERIRSFLSDARLSPVGRTGVEDYLADIGIPPPDAPGSHLYASCPEATHDTQCCYSNRSETGEVSIVCLAGHGGAGVRRYTEADLADLAGLDERIAAIGTDIVRDLPLTWATEKLVSHRIRLLSSDEVKATLDILRNIKAVQEAMEQHIPVAHLQLVIDTIRRRLQGDRFMGQIRLHFSDTSGTLAVLDGDDRLHPVVFKGDAPSPCSHLHKWMNTAGWKVRCTEDGIAPGPTFESHSYFNMALGGHPGALAALGIPILRTFDLPVAHVAEKWESQLPHRNIHGVIPFQWKKTGITPMDPLSFFLNLFAEGRLPLASQNDVRLFLMALASPLLRHIGQGQLGIYWLHGPVGAGKDYLAEMLSKIWERVARTSRPAKFDLSLTDDLELKRSFFSGIGAVYARAKEAGKRKGIADLLIRVAGTDFITARGMRLNETTIPNLFTIVADSAEDVPDRREISRRTTMIEVGHIDERVSKGEILQHVQDKAEGLLLGLMRLIESRPAEWYLSQANLGSRPIIPVALSRLLGADLPIVKGRDLDDVFEAMFEYITRFAGDEGEKQQRQSRTKDGREAQLVKHYRFSAFIETMRKQVGYSETFERHKAAEQLTTWIKRETPYGAVSRGLVPYLAITIADVRYAFKMVKSNRNFVFVPEAEFCAAVGCQPVADSPPLPAIISSHPGPDVPSPTPLATPAADDGVPTFTDDQLDEAQ